MQGRTLHFRHEPFTVSICSNVPGYTEPDHFTSTGDVQTFTDEFVRKLLTIQAKRESILTEKYQLDIEELQSKLQESQKKLGIYEAEDQNTAGDGREEEEEEEDLATTGIKRKRKNKSKGKSKRPFLDMEADISDDDDSEDDEDSNDCDEIVGLINDDEMEGNNDSFYRAIDNERPGTSSAAQPPENVVLSAEERQVKEKRLKKVKTCLSMLMTYIGQLTILGFNSQKYDVPVIRHYLVSSLIKQDGTP